MRKKDKSKKVIEKGLVKKRKSEDGVWKGKERRTRKERRSLKRGFGSKRSQNPLKLQEIGQTTKGGWVR